MGAPSADRCWCNRDRDVSGFSEFAFNRPSFVDRPFRRSFGGRFFHWPRRFGVNNRRFGWRGNLWGTPRRYGIRRGQDMFGAPRGQGWGRSYGTRAGGFAAGAGSLENQVYMLTNRERARAACQQLRLDHALGVAAEDHSQDMAAYQYMSHVDRYNEDPRLRMERSGYPVQYGWAENIAYGSRTAEQVMDGWMMSTGHRENILNCRLRAIGVGVARAQDGTLYWTQNFGGR
jgi:hypothetical protein